MAYTTIDNGEEHFNTILYTGDGSADNDITGVGFAPDWVWAKNRGAADAHWVLDSTRGATKGLYTNGTAAENTQNHLISFDSDGFSVGNQANGLNTSSNNYVSWNWKCNGGTTSSNSDGDITATVQANTTAGFSIVTYTGNGNASAQTVGHGLGAECKVVIAKSRSIGDESWRVFHESASQSGGGNLFLNGTSGLDTSDPARITSTNTTTFTLDGYHSTYDALNENSATYLAYCFAEKQGYSKFGKFRGNANADGAFIYTGFKPAWLMIKNIGASGTGYHWYIWDNKRDTINVMDNTLHADQSNAENTFDQDIDFVSNGFKLRGSGVGMNPNSHDAIYMAFAEHPFVSSKGVPVTAR
jgi:hypothetical protein